MSQRSATATVSAILWAFLCERTWLQPALARRVGVSVRTLRGRLEELLANGVPLERQDDPPHVYWSVPRGWVPDGVVFKNDAAADVLRFVARCPRSAKRDALMQRLLCGQGGAGVLPNASEMQEEEAVLSVVEDAARAKQALQMAYVTTRTGEQSARLVSVQRVSYGARIRFVAYCHRSHRLKWFRVSNVRWAKADGSTPYQAAPVEEVDALFARSIDGYADRGPPRRVSFVVTGDAARWVPGNLPSTAMTAEPCPEGVRVSVETAGMDVLARFVVGLGAEVILETPELARRVADLARGALRRGAMDGEDVAKRSVVRAVPREGERGGAERAVGGRGGRLSAGRSG